MLKFYKTEHLAFKEAYDFKIGEEQTRMLFTKLKRHYNISQTLVFKGRYKGRCGFWEIQLPKQTSIGLLLHEVAHAVDMKKGRIRHDKKFMRLLKRLNHYAKTKNYWAKELERRISSSIQSIDDNTKSCIEV